MASSEVSRTLICPKCNKPMSWLGGGWYGHCDGITCPDVPTDDRTADTIPDDLREMYDSPKDYDLLLNKQFLREHDVTISAGTERLIRQYLIARTGRAETRIEVLEAALRELDSQLRHLMWSSHGHLGRYGDDGEMQCIECAPFGAVDYKRDPIDKVRQAYNCALLAAQPSPRHPG